MTRRVRFFDYKYLREFEAKVGKAQNVVQGTYAEPINAKTPENPPRCHVTLNLGDLNLNLDRFPRRGTKKK
jgi:hypothetical protein